MVKTNINKTKKYLIDTVLKAKTDPYGLVQHVEIVERWAKYILNSHPEANEEVTLMGVWLHDIAHYSSHNDDHAEKGEKIAHKFLKEIKIDNDKITKITHCVRAHRCRDVLPESIEAKIVACADSASHLTDFAYIDIVMNNKNSINKYSAMDKLERDWRDVAIFPEVKTKLKKLYQNWKQLIAEFERINNEV